MKVCDGKPDFVHLMGGGGGYQEGFPESST